MSETKKSPVAEVKHFMRADQRARDKELITERVEIGSATFSFLQRMETRRLSQECMLSLDLRGKTPYECKRYQYRDRSFWMDHISYEMFNNGLKENNGVFTVGTFEKILEAEHTFRGMESKRQREQAALAEMAQLEQASRSMQDEAESGGRSRKAETAEPPEIIPLGWYRKRREARVQHSVEAPLTLGAQTMPARTVDLSSHGLKLALSHPLSVSSGDRAHVDLSALSEDMAAHLQSVPYRVVVLERTERDYRLRLALDEEADATVSDRLSRFVDAQLHGANKRRKQDYEDDRLTAYSLLAELFYCTSTPLVPIFLQQRNDGRMSLDLVGVNRNVQPLLEVFRARDDRLDLTGLSATERVSQLYALAREDGQRDPLLMVYRQPDQDAPQVVAEFEIKEPEAWRALVSSKCKLEQFRLFKVLLRPLHRPDCRKVYERIERLSERSMEEAESLVCTAYRHQAMGVLADLTSQVRPWGFADRIPSQSVVQAALPQAEVAAQRRGAMPARLQFGYVEQRHEDRYQVSLAAELVVDGQKLRGTTRDLSVRGVCISVDQCRMSLNRGDRVEVGLPGLQKRAGSRVRLTGIPCEVARVERGDCTLISLKRLPDARAQGVTDFLRDLIARNQGKITADLTDAVTAANSRLYGALAAESAASIPFLLLKNPESGDRLVKVALPEDPGSLLAFFEVAAGEYDFRPVALPSRLAHLSSGLRSEPRSEVLVYMYKRKLPDHPRFAIESRSDLDFETEAERRRFIHQAMEHDHCFVKLMAAAVSPPKDTEVNQIVEHLMALSPHRANRLQADFSHIAAVGDIFDVTRQVMENLETPSAS